MTADEYVMILLDVFELLNAQFFSTFLATTFYLKGEGDVLSPWLVRCLTFTELVRIDVLLFTSDCFKRQFLWILLFPSLCSYLWLPKIVFTDTILLHYPYKGSSLFLKLVIVDFICFSVSFFFTTSYTVDDDNKWSFDEDLCVPSNYMCFVGIDTLVIFNVSISRTCC